MVNVNSYIGSLMSEANGLVYFSSKPDFNDWYPLLQTEVDL